MRLFLRLLLLVVSGSVALVPARAQGGPPSRKTPVQTLAVSGTVGQQKISISLSVKGDEITVAKYQYSNQKEAVPFTNARIFGTTLILADEDGNLFRLHLHGSDGEATADVDKAESVDGTMDRNDLELPVKMSRVKK